MRFHSYEMWINSTDKFSKQDMRDAVSKANTKFQDGDMLYLIPVSYTHLTLPTICSV